MVPATWLLVLGNVLALLLQFVLFVGWFRRWLIKQVSEPIAELQRTVDDTKSLAQRAHDRLDIHLNNHYTEAKNA